jgi:hypothetical protein
MAAAHRFWNRRYVNVYRVGRCYGGPEEGGWWWDCYEYVRGYKFDTAAEAEQAEDELRELWNAEAWGDIGSVLGGEEIKVWREHRFAESRTRFTPHYE